MIVLGGAVAVALVVALLVQVSLGGKKQPSVQQEAKVEVLVASKNLRMGQELAAGDMRWQSWPQGSVFPGAVVREDAQNADEVFEGRLARNVAEGEPLIRTALVRESKGNFVAASLEPGERAVAIEVSASSMVGGFIGPGDFVDVILTYKETIRTEDNDPRVQSMIELNLDRMATETILQNVKVLAVDQSAMRGEEENIKVGKTVTLAVGIQEAERLALAAELGDLLLSLRGVGDNQFVEKQWPTISDARLTNVADEIFEEYKKIKKTGASSNNVRIYSGEQVTSTPAR